MSGFKKIVALVAIVVLSAGTGVAVAQDITGGQPPAETAAASPAPGPDLLLANGFQNENGFVPTTPCRILDTRKGLGKLQVSARKDIDVRGSESTFTTQGGNPGGCGIPAGATAIEATITAIDSGSGFLRAWPANLVQPNATFLNYDSAFNISNTGTITLCGGSNSLPCNANKDLSLQAYGSATHLVIDVGGFYIRQMAAVIEPTGVLGWGNRVVASTRLGDGSYQVAFDRNVSRCQYQATLADISDRRGYAMVDPRVGLANAVYVSTYDETGNQADAEFHLEVTC